MVLHPAMDQRRRAGCWQTEAFLLTVLTTHCAATGGLTFSKRRAFAQAEASSASRVRSTIQEPWNRRPFAIEVIESPDTPFQGAGPAQGHEPDPLRDQTARRGPSAAAAGADHRRRPVWERMRTPEAGPTRFALALVPSGCAWSWRRLLPTRSGSMNQNVIQSGAGAFSWLAGFQSESAKLPS